MCEVVMQEQPVALESVALESVALESVALKACSKCHVAKPLIEFFKSAVSLDGCKSACKTCSVNCCDENFDFSIISKRCHSCNVVKVGILFTVNKYAKDLLSVYCKECSAKIHKEKREKNRGRSQEDVVTPEHKECLRCKIDKPKSDYNENKGRPDWLEAYCKDCVYEQAIKSRYGATIEWVKATIIRQGGGCGVCKITEDLINRRFDIDHDHLTHKLRGVLCNPCNFGIGAFRDNRAFIVRAINYIETNRVIKPTDVFQFSVKPGRHKALRKRLWEEQGGLCAMLYAFLVLQKTEKHQ